MLHRQDVQRRAADVSVVDGMVQRRFVSQAAAAAVDEHSALLHLLELFILENIPRRFIQRHMERYDVARLQQLVHIDRTDMMRVHDVFADKRVVRLDAAAEGLHARRDGPPDMAEADEADEVAAHAVDRPGHGAVFPAAVDVDVRQVFRQLPNQRQYHSARMVGNIVDAVRHVIDDENAVAGSPIQIDVVIPCR